MKPKYQLAAEITELSKWSLPPVTQVQIQWGYDHCLEKYAHLSRGKMYCLECGHSWKPEHNRKIQHCPNCNARLKRIKHYRFRGNEADYMAVVTTCGGYQVVRMIWISKRLAMNWPAEYFAKEVMQHWIDENGHATTMSISVNGLSMAYDQWAFSSEMKVRETRGGYKANLRHNIYPSKTHPGAQILPVFKRNGFKGDFHCISPIKFFPELLLSQQFETLLKAKQFSLLRYSVDRATHYRWPSIRICIRNKYTVSDASMWIDYLDLLIYFRKDIRNAVYVCPKNLKAEHDRLMLKKKKKQAIESAEKKRKHLEQAQVDYLFEKSKFFDIKLSEGDLNIVVLDNVAEFMKEGDELHHCVFTNSYYAKANSLIMSARKENKRIETIEVALDRMEIVQSRGLCNQNSEYHDQIISLVRNNMNMIAQVAV